MLKSLYIKNYALIDSLEIDFSPGFSVITGETGAGKSIILGALSLILGQRADTKSIKAGQSKCIIEGVFDVTDYDLESFCEQQGIEYDSDTYILRREIMSTGKSRAFINDSPVSLNQIRLLGEQLIDIHSQHKNLLLGDSRFQMQVVDVLAGTGKLLKEYQQAYKEYIVSGKALQELIRQAARSREEEDYLRFQYEALAEAKLVKGEQEELEMEIETLSHAEEIKSALYKIHALLSDDESGVLSRLKEARDAARGLTAIYNASTEILQRLENSYIDLKDLSPEMERYAGDVEFNPERLEYIQSRLDLIYSLQQKHRVGSVEELIRIQEELENNLTKIDAYAERIEQLEKATESRKKEMSGLASRLSRQRRGSVEEISRQLIQRVSGLGMPNVRFECQVTPKDFPDIMGADNLQFMFSANRNIPLQPVSEIASGGEVSRVMLVLKSMIAGATALPTIIFDEVDTGVSGEIADRMGQIMHEFGNRMQVIAITHLPQIAARGQSHYFVYKSEEVDNTTTHIRLLGKQERISELARMLSGAQVTEAAIENAKVMLGNGETV